MSNIQFNEDGTIKMKGCRLSYPHLFTPWAQNEGEEKKYSGRFLIARSTHAAEIKQLQQHMLEKMKEYFDARIPLDKLCFRDGDQTAKPEDVGCWYLSASEKTRPQVIGKDKAPLIESDDTIYAGCYVNVLFKLWKQQHPKYGKRINANLLAVQFVKDGDRFGAPRPNVDEHFDDESDGEPSEGGRGKPADDDGFGDDDIPF